MQVFFQPKKSEKNELFGWFLVGFGLFFDRKNFENRFLVVCHCLFLSKENTGLLA